MVYKSFRFQMRITEQLKMYLDELVKDFQARSEWQWSKITATDVIERLIGGAYTEMCKRQAEETKARENQPLINIDLEDARPVKKATAKKAKGKKVSK